MRFSPNPLRNAVTLAFVLAAVALLALAIVVVPTWLAYFAFSGAPGSPTQEEWAVRVSDERRSVLWIVGGVLAMIGLVYTALRHRLSQSAYELDRDANRTGRYASAIDQLGSDKLDIRLGGIYALERIALDSERDRGPIGEVLSAFVREHAQASAEEVTDFDDLVSVKPSTDVQAALTVLGRRPADGTHPPANLSGATLIGANFSELGFREASFNNADLRHSSFSRADLDGAGFIDANLRYSNLAEASLRDAILGSADIRQAWLQGADLRGAYLGQADLSDTELVDACLTGTDLTGTNLTDTRANGALFLTADLSRSKLVRTHFMHADLTGAKMELAQLSQTDFRLADLTNADLRMAGIEDIQVSGATLKGTRFKGHGLDSVAFSDEQRAEADIGEGW